MQKSEIHTVIKKNNNKHMNEQIITESFNLLKIVFNMQITMWNPPILGIILSNIIDPSSSILNMACNIFV